MAEKKSTTTEEIKPDKDGYVYYKCSNPKCDFIKKGLAKDITEEQFEQLKQALKEGKCPKCGAKGFILITKAKYEILEKQKKKKEQEEAKADPKLVKLKQDKIKQDIKRIQDELERDLKADKITAKGFATLMYNLIAMEFKYYSKDRDLNLNAREFRDLAKANSEAILEKYQVKTNSEEDIYTLQTQIDENTDKKTQMESLLLDRYTKEIAENATLGNLEETDLERINKEILQLESEIAMKEKYFSSLEDRVERVQDRNLQIAQDSFIKGLKEASK